METLIDIRDLIGNPANLDTLKAACDDRYLLDLYAALETTAPAIDISPDNRILDGNHRVLVAIAKGRKQIPARVCNRTTNKLPAERR